METVYIFKVSNTVNSSRRKENGAMSGLRAVFGEMRMGLKLLSPSLTLSGWLANHWRKRSLKAY